MNRRQFVAWTLRACLLGLGGYGTLVEPSLLRVSRVRIPLSRNCSFLHGLRIGVAGDFHVSGRRSERLCRRAVSRLMEEKPDLILLPGDFAARNTPMLDLAASILSDLEAPLGVYAVPGNHEIFMGMDMVEESLSGHDPVLLRNHAVMLERGGGRFALAGLDNGLMRLDDWDQTLEIVEDGIPVLLMVHEPDVADRIRSRRDDIVLQVSGHSHGGQVRVPFVGPPVLPPLGKRYHSGLYLPPRAPHPVFTTTGVGTLGFVRIGCRPEIAVLELFFDDVV